MKDNDAMEVSGWFRALTLKEIRILYTIGFAMEMGEMSERVASCIRSQFAEE